MELTKTSVSLKSSNSSLLQSIRDARGFSLIEILIAMLIVALVFGGIIGVTRSRFESEGRRVAQRLQGTIKYFYNAAASSGFTYRLIFDLEEQSVSVEMAEGAYVQPTGEDAEIIKKEEESKGKEEEVVEEELEPGGSPPLTLTSPSKLEFGPAEGPSGLIKSFHMPAKVFIHEIRIAGLPEPIIEGKAYVHFYPGGYMDKAILILSTKEKDRFFVIKTNSITGLSKISRTYPEDKP